MLRKRRQNSATTAATRISCQPGPYHYSRLPLRQPQPHRYGPQQLQRQPSPHNVNTSLSACPRACQVQSKEARVPSTAQHTARGLSDVLTFVWRLAVDAAIGGDGRWRWHRRRHKGTLVTHTASARGPGPRSCCCCWWLGLVGCMGAIQLRRRQKRKVHASEARYANDTPWVSQLQARVHK